MTYKHMANEQDEDGYEGKIDEIAEAHYNSEEAEKIAEEHYKKEEKKFGEGDILFIKGEGERPNDIFILTKLTRKNYEGIEIGGPSFLCEFPLSSRTIKVGVGWMKIREYEARIAQARVEGVREEFKKQFNIRGEIFRAGRAEAIEDVLKLKEEWWGTRSGSETLSHWVELISPSKVEKLKDCLKSGSKEIKCKE